MVTFKFCWCGRLEGSDRCLKEKHVEGKKVKVRQVKFSGKSDHQKENGGFYGLRGR